MATKEYNLDLDVKGKIKLTDVPNQTGKILVWNGPSNTISLREHSEIIGDLGLEVISNKTTTLTSPNNTTYPTTQAVSDAINAVPAPSLQTVTTAGNSTSNNVVLSNSALVTTYPGGSTNGQVITINNPVAYAASTPVVGAIVFKHPPVGSSTMVLVNFSGFIYGTDRSYKGQLSFYYTSGAIGATGKTSYTVSSGALTFSSISVGLDASNNLSIIFGDVTTNWAYPKLVIESINFGHSGFNLADWQTGWTSELVTDLSTYTGVSDLGLKTIMPTDATNYIANQTSLQPNSNFNISGTGTSNGISVGSTIGAYKGFNSTQPFSFLNGGNGQSIYTKGILSSDNYADGSLVPINGIYSKGGIRNGTTLNGIGDFVTIDLTGLLNKRTPSQVATDIGAITAETDPFYTADNNIIYKYRGDLGTIDLSSTFINGIYRQNSSAGATAALNYPIALAGVLSVYGNNANHIIQEYTTYNGNYTYKRYYYGSSATWSTWLRTWTEASFGGSSINNWNTAYSNSHAPLTLTGQNYLSLSGQQITANPINLSGSNVTGLLPYTSLSGTPTIPNGNIYTINGTLTNDRTIDAKGHLFSISNSTNISLTSTDGTNTNQLVIQPTLTAFVNNISGIGAMSSDGFQLGFNPNKYLIISDANGTINNRLMFDNVSASRDYQYPNASGTLALLSDIPSQYILPTASATVLGGIKVGSGLTINATTGVLSATNVSSGTVTSVSSTSSATGLTLTTATGATTPAITLALTTGYSIPTIANQTIWTNKQDGLIGTGFVKSTGGTISYDNSVYYLASNPAGYITSYVDTTYTAGSGLTLTGTVFSLPVVQTGTGNVVTDVVQTANGITVKKGLTLPTTDTVTRLRGTATGTYTSGDLTLLAGTNTTITQSGANITINSTDTNTLYTAGAGIAINGSNVISNTSPNANHTGDVTGATALTITNSAVTFAKIQDVPGVSLLGRYSGVTGVVQSISKGAGINIHTDGTIYSGRYNSGVPGSAYSTVLNDVGFYANSTTTETGAIEISIPYASSMTSVQGTIRQYNNNYTSKFEISLYTNNVFATFTGQHVENYNVRLYRDIATNTYRIYIGELTSTWNWMHTTIDRITASYSGSGAVYTTTATNTVVSMATAFTGAQIGITASNTRTWSELTQPITGYVLGTNTPLVASNTILQSFGNLQAQINSGTTNFIRNQTTLQPSSNFNISGIGVAGRFHRQYVSVGSVTTPSYEDVLTYGDATAYQSGIQGINTLSSNSGAGLAFFINHATLNTKSISLYLNPDFTVTIPNLSGTGNRMVVSSADGTLGVQAITTGTVTSVSSTIGGNALNVSGTPITASGTLAYTWQGSAGHYINGLGNLATLSSLPQGTVTSIILGNGLVSGTITTTGTVTLGTPGATTLSSINAVTATSHTHAFTPGGTTSQYITGAGTLAAFPTITTGTVTNVSFNTAPQGLSFSVINPSTTPVLDIAYSTGYSLPTIANQNIWTAKQNALNGTGLVRMAGTVVSYDNTAYYPSSNPNNYSPVQNLTLVGQTLGISGGNTVTLPTSLDTNLGNTNLVSNSNRTFDVAGNAFVIKNANFKADGTNGMFGEFEVRPDGGVTLTPSSGVVATPTSATAKFGLIKLENTSGALLTNASVRVVYFNNYPNAAIPAVSLVSTDPNSDDYKLSVGNITTAGFTIYVSRIRVVTTMNVTYIVNGY